MQTEKERAAKTLLGALDKLRPDAREAVEQAAREAGLTLWEYWQQVRGGHEKSGN